MTPNIIDQLCERLKLKGTGRYTELGKQFGVTRQAINGWKMRNKIPESFYRRTREITGMEYEEFLPGGSRATRVPMKDFINDPTRYIEMARSGATVELTVTGQPVVKISSADARA